MADISKIITPDGSTYDLKDTVARNSAAAAIAAIPSNVSELNNDSGYITVSAIPSNVSAFNNDAGYMTGMTILSYGSSTWNDFLAAYNDNKVVYCRASSNSNPGTGTQGRMAFMAFINFSGTTPTSVEFQYYRSVSSHSDAQQGDQVYIYKLTNTGAWSVTVRESYTKIVAGTNLTSTYSSGVLTMNADAALPAVSSADNGKILEVVNGAWSAAEPTAISVNNHCLIIPAGLGV